MQKMHPILIAGVSQYYTLNLININEVIKIKKVNPICEECWKWEVYGKECRVWWENKKECSMFAGHPEQREELITERDVEFKRKERPLEVEL